MGQGMCKVEIRIKLALLNAWRQTFTVAYNLNELLSLLLLLFIIIFFIIFIR